MVVAEVLSRAPNVQKSMQLFWRVMVHDREYFTSEGRCSCPEREGLVSDWQFGNKIMNFNLIFLNKGYTEI